MKKFFIIFLIFILFPLTSLRADGPRAMTTGAEPPPATEAGSDSGDNELFEADYFTGAATHRIEIEVPQGRAGLTPKLVLEYNSHRRDAASLFGFGWDMNPGYIERNTQNNIDYNERDFIFSAQGQRRPLIYSNRLATNNCEEYNAKVETGDFIRYFYCGGPTGNHWIAYDKQGVRYLYGNAPGARLQDASQRIFRWYLEEIRDSNNNFIRFNYFQPLSIGANSQILLDSIFYTKNDSGGVTTNAPFQIRFRYDNDTSSQWVRPARFSLFTGQSLQKIQIMDQGDVVRTYEFTYDKTSGSPAALLKTIDVTANNGSETIQLPQKTFDYSTISSSSNPWGTQMQTTVALSNDDLSLYDETHGFFDLNGDGYLDRVVGRPGSLKFSVYYGSPNGPQNVATDWADKWDHLPLDGKIAGNDTYFGVYARILDINGDMLPDRVYGGTIPFSDETSFSGFYVHYNTGSEWKWGKKWADPLCSPSVPDHELLCGFLHDAVNIQDVTGDGLPDRIHWEGTVFHVYRNLGDTFSTQVEDWADPIPSQYRGKTFLRDMNGDGLPDRVWADNFDGVGYGFNGFNVYLNNGHGWDSATTFFISDPNGDAAMGETADLIDINRDGLADRVVGNPSGSKIRVYWNKGRTFETTNFLEAKDPASANFSGIINYNGFYPGLLDLDGDGYLDRIVPNGTGGLGFSPFRPDKGSGLYLLNETGNGLGVATKIEYTPASRFINHLLPLSLHVITRQIVQEGDETKTTDIRYAGGFFFPDFYNPSGRTFNGFNFVEIRDPLGNVEHRWHYQAWDDTASGRLFTIPEHTPTDLSSPLPTRDEPSTHPANGKPWNQVAFSGRIYHQDFYFDPRDGRTLSKHHDIDQEWTADNPDRSNPNSTRKFVSMTGKTRRDYEGVGARTTGWKWQYDPYTGNKIVEKDLGEVGVDTLHEMAFENFQTISLPGFGNLVTSRAQIITAKEGGSILRNRTARTFDPKGNLQTQTELLIDNAGQRDLTTSFTHDRFGNVLTRTDPLNRTTTYTYETIYNTYPKTETITVSGRQFVTSRTFDGTFGKLAVLVTPDNRTWHFDYDPIGRLKQKTFSNHWEEKYEYVDGLARPGRSSQKLTVVRKFTNIDSDGRSNSTPREIIYKDGQGRVIQTSVRSERSGNVFRTQTRQYVQQRARNETFANLPFFNDGSFVETSGRFTHELADSLGRTIQITPPAGDAQSPTAPRTIRYSAPGNSWMKVFTDEMGKTRREVMNGRGQLTHVWNVVSGVQIRTRYDYDFWGHRTKVWDNSNNYSETIYDNLGRKISETSMDRGHWVYTYDDGGNATEQTDARGFKTVFTYDEINRPKTKDAKLLNGNVAEHVTFHYDDAVATTGSDGNTYSVRYGELFEIVDKNGWTHFGYDQRGLVNKFNRQISGLSGNGLTEYLRYDDGRVREMKYPGNKVHLQYQYDNGGNIRKITRLGQTTENLYTINADTAYDVNGHLLMAQYGDQTQDVFSYYPNSLRPQETRTTGLQAGAQTMLREMTYQYNAMGNMTDIADGTNPTTTPHDGSLKNIQYDDLHRITGFSYYQGNGSGLKAETYSYDALGNMQTNTESYPGGTYTYGVAGHVHALKNIGAETFSHDVNGNMTTGRGKTMTYDESNRLSRVQMENGRIVDYGYGALGERLSKKTSGTGNAGAGGATAIGDGETYYFGNYLEVRDGGLVHNIYAGNKLVAVIGEGQWGQIAEGGCEENGVENVSDVIARNVGRSLRLRSGQAPQSPKCHPSFMIGRTNTISPLWQRDWKRIDHVLMVEVFLLVGLFALFLFPLPFQSVSLRGPEGAVAISNCVRGRLLRPYGLAMTFCYALLIIVLIFPAGTFAYVFPTDVADNWPPADQNFFLYVHTDHLGSSQLMTEGQTKSTHDGLRFIKGEVVQRIEYTPFGKERYVLNATLSEGPKFTDQQNDIEDGLYFYQSRYYDPVLGRFVQPDNFSSNAHDPQTLNAYAYVLNNPLKYVDPSGHREFEHDPFGSSGGEDDSDDGGGDDGLTNFDTGDTLKISEKEKIKIDFLTGNEDRAFDRAERNMERVDRFLAGEGTITDKDIDRARGRDRFGFGRDWRGEFDVDARAFTNVDINTANIIAGGLNILSGLSSLTIGGFLFVKGVAEISTAEMTFGAGLLVGLHTIGGSGPFISVGFYQIGQGIEIVFHEIRKK